MCKHHPLIVRGMENHLANALRAVGRSTISGLEEDEPRTGGHTALSS